MVVVILLEAVEVVHLQLLKLHRQEAPVVVVILREAVEVVHRWLLKSPADAHDLHDPNSQVAPKPLASCHAFLDPRFHHPGIEPEQGTAGTPGFHARMTSALSKEDPQQAFQEPGQLLRLKKRDVKAQQTE